jgi:hypothetical protein
LVGLCISNFQVFHLFFANLSLQNWKYTSKSATVSEASNLFHLNPRFFLTFL